MIVFFDTETNGLPRDYKAPASTGPNWPMVLQMAWAVYAADGEHITSQQRYIQLPEGVEIEPNAQKVHGITRELLNKEGVTLGHALADFMSDMKNSRLLVAHNMAFDKPIIHSEMLREGIVPPKIDELCTMETSTRFCAIPGGRPYKWPKLSALYAKVLDGATFDGAHNAIHDVEALAEVFFAAVDKNLIPRWNQIVDALKQAG